MSRPSVLPRPLPSVRRRFGRAAADRVAALCAVVLGFIVVCAIAGPFLPGIDPYSGTLADALRPPAWEDGGSTAHVLGTDPLGRDVLSRLIVGARTTVVISVLSVLASMAIGTGIGLVAGYFGGVVGAVLMRITDAVLAIPSLVLGIAFAAALGTGLINVVIVVTATTWAFFARVVRGETLRLRETDYIVAAGLSGIGHVRTLLVHVLPNVVAPVIVMATLQVGNTIIMGASLSFLGLGVPSPLPEWGLMLAESKDYLQLNPWLVVAPALVLAITILCSNVLGDWVRDRLDPQSTIRTGGTNR